MVMRWIRMLSAALVGVALVACGGGGGSGSPSSSALPAQQTGTVTLAVSDSPISEYDQVLMEIAEIRFLSDGGQDILVLEEPVTVDFLALENFSEVLLRREVVTGTYSKIRLILNSLTLVKLDDGGNVVDEQPVRLNGLRKIDINPRGPFQVRGGEELVIDLEVDLHKSIHVVGAGNSGQVRFRPVIFATVDTEPAFDKLFRVEGTVEAVDETAGTFTVCNLRRAFLDGVNRPEPADVCVVVDPEASTPYFDPEANPSDLGLAANHPVVVYGKFDEFATGDRLVAAVVASGLQFERLKGLAASEYRPMAPDGDFDLGQVIEACTVADNPLRVVVPEAAPAFVESATTGNAEQVDLTALPLACRRAEVEGYRETDDPVLRAFIVLLGDSLEGVVERVGVLTEKMDTAAEGDFDLALTDSTSTEVVVVSDATRLVKIISTPDGDVVEDLTLVPTGIEVTVFGVLDEDTGVIAANFILLEE
jgi:hypothetical protein